MVVVTKYRDVFVTKNKEIIVVLSNPKEIALKNLLNLKGCMKDFDDGRNYKDIIGDVIIEKSNTNRK